MKQCFGLVAEFNPFHNGHAALCAQARAAGATHIVAVMSGNFVQRGCLAVTDKYIRTRAALLGGCDLIIELPLPYAVATASRFAAGAVGLLRATGCVDSLCFGSESDNLADLQAVAQAVDCLAVRTAIKGHMGTGITFARARQLAVAAIFGEQVAHCLTTPNNILAVEYLRQSAAQGWHPNMVPIRRVGTSHDSTTPKGPIASASYLRQHPEALAAYVPPQALAVYQEARCKGLFPAQPERLDTAVIAHLRRLSPADLSQLPDISEGIENRLYKALSHCATLAQLEQEVKTKRYPLARVRRLILHAFLGVSAQDSLSPPPYLHVLGFNPKGAELLAEMKRKKVALPVHTSLAHLEKLNGTCQRFATLEATATGIYGLALPNPPSRGFAYDASAVFLK